MFGELGAFRVIEQLEQPYSLKRSASAGMEVSAAVVMVEPKSSLAQFIWFA